MAASNLTDRSSGQTITVDVVNSIHDALETELVGRSSSGTPTSGQSLGTAAIPWGTAHITDLVLNNSSVDTSQIIAPKNRIVSGKTNGVSDKLDFLTANGAALTATLEAASTNLIVDISGTSYTATSDISITGLSAAPSSNNTCAINDANIVNSYDVGESDSRYPTITIDAVGSEVSALVGQWAAFKGATEIFIAYVKSATELTNAFRGFFVDSSNNAIDREALNDNDTLTLMNLGWVFLDDGVALVDVSYTTPVWSFTAPSSPATGDYWLDLNNQLWRRYDGSSFVDIGRTLVGYLVMDATNCIASRSLDKYFTPFKNSPVELELSSSEIIISKLGNHRFQIWGNNLMMNFGQISWNITTDLESGVTEAASTDYYLYITQDGQPKMSDKKPNYRADLDGDFHPQESWWCAGATYNDSSSDLINSRSYRGHKNKTFTRAMTGNSGGTGIKTDLTVEGLFLNQRYLVSIHHSVQWSGTGVATHAIEAEQNGVRIFLSRGGGQNNSSQRVTYSTPATPFYSDSDSIEFDVATATTSTLHSDTYIVLKEDFGAQGETV